MYKKQNAKIRAQKRNNKSVIRCIIRIQESSIIVMEANKR